MENETFAPPALKKINFNSLFFGLKIENDNL